MCMWLCGGVPQTEGLVHLSYWRHTEYILKSVRTCKSSMKLSPICLCFLPVPLFHPFLPLSSAIFSPSFPPQGRRRELSTGWASSSGFLGACWLCATILPCMLLRQVVLDGRDTAWVDIYGCFLRKPDSLEELGSSVGLSWMRDGGSGNGRKASFSQQQGKFPS